MPKKIEFASKDYLSTLLKRIRKSSRMTQQELHSISTLAISTISHIECNANYSMNTLFAYLKGLNSHLIVKTLSLGTYNIKTQNDLIILLKGLRNNDKISQKIISKHIGISTIGYWKIENKKNDLTVKFFLRIMQIFECQSFIIIK